jgi:hypothetical protein
MKLAAMPKTPAQNDNERKKNTESFKMTFFGILKEIGLAFAAVCPKNIDTSLLRLRFVFELGFLRGSHEC